MFTTTMPTCADGELCKALSKELHGNSGYACRAGCGGRLHGICGEVEDTELSDVLANLNITPGKRANPAAVAAAQTWAELEEQKEIADALPQDAKDIFLEKVANEYVEDDSLSDQE